MDAVSGFHPRLAVNPNSLVRDSLAAYVEALGAVGLKRAGVGRAALDAEGWDESFARTEAAGIEVAYLGFRVFYALDAPETWDQANAHLRAAIDAADRFGSLIYGVTGPGPAVGLSWEEATAAFVEAMRPSAEYAHSRGVKLMLEPTNPMFADIHCLHTLRETLEVAEAAGVSLCVDIHGCWAERALAETIARAGPLIGLVQLSDVVPAWRTMDRALPGEGVIDLERFVGSILETGFDGLFDLELWGDPGIPDVEAVRRSADYLGSLLERLGG